MCEDSALIGAPFYVMERRHGVVLDEELRTIRRPAASCTRRSRSHLCADWSPARGRLAGGWAGRDRTPTATCSARWRAGSTASRGAHLRHARARAAFRVADRSAPVSPSPTVIHNDYKLNNVLLDAGDPQRLSAVLDWEMATVGDPISDIAALLVYWTEPGEEEMLGSLKSVTSDLTFTRRDQVAELYARLSGRDLGTIDWYVAFAYLNSP